MNEISDELRKTLCDQCRENPFTGPSCFDCDQKVWNFYIKPTTTKGIDNWIKSLVKAGIKA